MDTVDERLAKWLEKNYPPEYNIPLNYPSAALENARVVKGSEGYLFGFTAFSSLGAGQFIMVFDASSLPADGVVCSMVFAVAATSDREVAWIPPRYMQNGIVICNSTTSTTKTLGAANCLFDIQYV